MNDDHWLVRPRTIRLLWAIFIAALALNVLAEAFVAWKAHFRVEAVFGFGAWFGFLSCVAMILGAKALALLLKRSDTYYEDSRDD